MNEKRLITELQERVFRKCHHDFEGYSVKEAAAVLGLTEAGVRRILREVKKIAPQLFPILSKRQKLVNDLWLEGKSYNEIADELGVSVSTVDSTVQDINKKFGYEHLKISKTLSFNDSMSNKVKERF